MAFGEAVRHGAEEWGMDFGLFVEFPYAAGLSDQENFAQSFALVDEAESLGVDSVWLPEYHFSPISVLSSPITVAAAIAARTQRVRIGMGVLLLPLGNPLRFAEDGATLDHISRGRLDFGIGSEAPSLTTTMPSTRPTPKAGEGSRSIWRSSSRHGPCRSFRLRASTTSAIPSA